MTDKKASLKLAIDAVEQMRPPALKSPQPDRLLTPANQSILNRLNDVVFMLNAAGQFVFINKASEKRTGIPARALLGLTYLDIINPASREAAQKSFQHAMNGNEGPSFEVERVAPTGEKITVEVSWKTLFDKDKPIGLLGSMRDITDRKKTQQALEKAHVKLVKQISDQSTDLQKTNKLLMENISERLRVEKKLEESEKTISDLKGELETKKLVNRAKGIIARHYGITDGEAVRLLQKESRRRSRKIKEIARAVIASKNILE